MATGRPRGAVRCDRGDAPVIELQGEVPPKEFLIMPRGVFRTTKGEFVVDDEAVESIMADFAERGVDLVIDYEHQTMSSEDNGQPAPAAGWFKVEARDDGIWAVVTRWVDKAAAFLQNREYRYHSPVFTYDEDTMRVLSVETESLVNYPASLAQTPLAAKDTAPVEGVSPSYATRKELTDMAEDIIKDALETAKAEGAKKDAQIVALTKDFESAKRTGEESDALIASVMDAVECDDRTALVGKCKKCKDDATKVADLTAEVEASRAKQEEAEKAALIESAGLGEDKVAWLKKQTIATVKSYVEDCAKVPDVSTDPQSASAKKGDSDKPEDWFVERCMEKGMDDDKVKAEWRKHLAYKAKHPRPAYATFEPAAPADSDEG